VATSTPLQAVVDSPLGRLGFRVAGDALGELVFLSGHHRLLIPRSGVARHIAQLLEAYFADPKTRFDIKLQVSGTPFQRQVWKQLQAIPVGEVTTYGAIARRLGSSPRAVGNACRANPVPIVVPCHRVVSRDGVGGFAGDTRGRLVTVKKQLLRHEGVEI